MVSFLQVFKPQSIIKQTNEIIEKYSRPLGKRIHYCSLNGTGVGCCIYIPIVFFLQANEI